CASGTATVLCIPSSDGWFGCAPAPAGRSISLAVRLFMRPRKFNHGARTALSALSGGSQSLLVPEGQHDNSPTFQRWGRTVGRELVPKGRLKTLACTEIGMFPKHRRTSSSRLLVPFVAFCKESVFIRTTMFVRG